MRGLTFDTDDVDSGPVHHTMHASEAAGSSTASTRRFHRAVSFSAHPQVLELKESSQEAEADEGQSNEGQVPFDESNLPDGITAIAVTDPNDPSIIVMQVGKNHNMHVSVELVNVHCLQQLNSRSCKLCLQVPTCSAYRLLVCSRCICLHDERLAG